MYLYGDANKATVSVKTVGHLIGFILSQCWSKRFATLTAINSTEKGDEWEGKGGSVSTIFVED